MLNKKDFQNKIEGVRRIYATIEEAQFIAAIECEYTFRVYFSQKDREFIESIAFKLGFELQVINLDDGKAEYIFS